MTQDAKQFWQEDIFGSHWKKWKERIFLFFLFAIFGSFLLLTLFLLTVLLVKGGSSLSWEFLTSTPKNNMTAGGIFPAVIGTIFITFVSACVSIFFGIIAGIYLAEYAEEGKFKNTVWIAVKNLAGVPSVVYGLFGVALFMETLAMQKSVLTAGLTLGSLSLPVVITATVQSITSVPFVLKQASLGLGASRWQTLYKIILPSAAPGILTGIILAITRSIGETAPILFTGVAYYLSSPTYSLSSSFMALPYHIFALVTQNAQESEATKAAYGASLVLVLLVVLLSMITLFIRFKMKKPRS